MTREGRHPMTVVLKTSELDEVDQAAERAGKNRHQFMREAILDKAREGGKRTAKSQRDDQ